MLYLVNPENGSVYRVAEDAEFVIGRGEECDAVILDEHVSRKHAVIKNGVLKHLSSTANTHVDSKVVDSPVTLRPGMTLQIGNTFLSVTDVTPPPSEQSERSPINDERELPRARWLICVTEGMQKGAEFAVESGTHLIGSDPSACNIVFLGDSAISRRHALMTLDSDGTLKLRDVGSRNGTFLPGALLVEGDVSFKPHDEITIGKSVFMVVDRHAEGKTVPIPPPERPAEVHQGDEWQKTVISKTHLRIAASCGIALVALLMGYLTIFHTSSVSLHVKDPKPKISNALNPYKDLTYTYNEASGTLFLTGHLLTRVDHSEMLHAIRTLKFVQKLEEHVVIDELVWENMNSLLSTEDQWQGISIHAPEPGRFVMRGYVEKLEMREALEDYMNQNFPYIDLLENHVVVESNLNKQIMSIIESNGFHNVTFENSEGNVVFSGNIGSKDERKFKKVLEQIRPLKGIRQVSNFTTLISGESGVRDLSASYKVTGYSKSGGKPNAVMIGGKIFAEGDLLDGMIVSEIEEKQVLLEKAGIKFSIPYTAQ